MAKKKILRLANYKGGKDKEFQEKLDKMVNFKQSRSIVTLKLSIRISLMSTPSSETSIKTLGSSYMTLLEDLWIYSSYIANSRHQISSTEE